MQTQNPTDPHWYSNVEAPYEVSDAAALKWDMECDVVIVGFGGAGVAAGLQAVELGLSAIALDRFHGGGATEASGGVLYAGGGTVIQKDANVEDSTEEMFRYLRLEVGDIVSEDNLRHFCEQSPETVDWLIGHGAKFKGVHYPKKTSYPGVEYFLYHSDNSLIAPYKDEAKPAARGHRTFVSPEEGIRATSLGGPIYRPLRQSFLDRGGSVREQSEARQLVVDKAGEILGIKTLEFPAGAPEAEQHKNLLAKASAIQAKWLPIIPGSAFFLKRAERMIAKARALENNFRVERFYRAHKGVVLAAGGFVFNRSMLKHYAPKFADTFPLGTTADQGDGIRLGQTVGGAVGNMDRASAWRFINPPIAWSHGIVVNEAGERFINESSYGAAIGTSIALDQNGRAWSILDQTLVRESLSQIKGGKVLPFQRDLARLNFWFAAKKASTVEALASKIGVNASGLAKTVERYNSGQNAAQSDAFAKSNDDIRQLTTPPFYGIDIGLSAKLFPCPTITLGGLRVEENTGAVLNDAGRPIGGLYAAGRTAIGICSWNYLSGLSIADCIYSGRRAARSIASGP